MAGSRLEGSRRVVGIWKSHLGKWKMALVRNHEGIASAIENSVEMSIGEPADTEMLETGLIRAPKYQVYCYIFSSLWVEVDSEWLDHPKAEGMQVEKNKRVEPCLGLGLDGEGKSSMTGEMD